MKYASTATTVVLVIILAALTGCESKKDKASQAPPQKAGELPQSHKPGVAAATPQDGADAAAANARVLAQVKAGDFAAIYKGASAGFKEVGKESQFVALWTQTLQKIGAMKESKEISHTVRPDNFHVFVHHVQYDKLRSELRLTFGRSKDGKMELTGINQKDLPAGK